MIQIDVKKCLQSRSQDMDVVKKDILLLLNNATGKWEVDRLLTNVSIRTNAPKKQVESVIKDLLFQSILVLDENRKAYLRSNYKLERSNPYKPTKKIITTENVAMALLSQAIAERSGTK